MPADEDNRIIGSDASYLDTWKEMEKLVEQGLVKSIGISNFNSKQVEDILSIAKIKPVTNQVSTYCTWSSILMKKGLIGFKCRI